eukprot:COSAG02_NODE_8175_length_2675_cov_10.726027_1_plen_28_part_10
MLPQESSLRLRLRLQLQLQLRRLGGQEQ